MTPAEELRSAADRVRTLAAEASPGPWAPNDMGGVKTTDELTVAEVWPLYAAPNGNAAWIAAMHPGVGAALADWLDREGRQEAYTLAEFGHRSACPEALAVARAILGSQP
jgi:hypothetical protein